MIFPSVIFLFAFLPTVLFFYYVPFRKNLQLKNILLLAASIFFYAWGEKWNVLLLIVSMLMNYALGMLADKESRNAKLRKPAVIAAAVLNLSLLFVFKYLDFAISNIDQITGAAIPLTHIKLPIGISFFTFQALSYVIDVYRGDAKAQKDPLKVGLYISLFPQLVAGPIVRYTDVEEQLKLRKESAEKFASGTERFITGLGKKVLLADTFSVFADRIMTEVSGGAYISPAAAWFGTLCFILRIYFDFAGYSDMAIGLGRMFGFEFNENFNYPYISSSVTEFWRRWHISLGTWFRDYVYFPLGGSKKGKGRTFFNQFIVWLLTGLWHGANWTYVIWGLMNYVFLMIEKVTGIAKKKPPFVLMWAYQMLIFGFGLVFFFSPDVSTALLYISQMFGAGARAVQTAADYAAGTSAPAVLLDLTDNWIFFAAGIAFSTPAGRIFDKNITLKRVLLIAVLMLSIIYILKGGYSPFIYFNF